MCEKFCKNITLDTLYDKYGHEANKGLVAHEPIKKGEKLWNRMIAGKSTFTRAELFDIIDKKPQLKLIVTSFCCMVGDDLYTIPTACLEENAIIDERQFINHSCDPNCGYSTEKDGTCITVAIKDINPGDELTYHYGMLETEASLTYGHVCNCRSSNCSKVWKFDLYRREIGPDPQTQVSALFVKHMKP